MQGYGNNFRAPRVDVHDFAMVPRADIPRSSFRMQHQHKTTFNAARLYPVYVQEVLPGDMFNVKMSAFVRMATPLFPLMDNLSLESFFFFVPNRLVWINWYKFMGEQENPADSISFSIPQVVSPAGGFAQFSIFDYMGLPTSGQTAGGNTISVSALPFRAYNIIYNQWFRDENLQNATTYGSTSGTGIAAMDNGPDPIANYGIFAINKRHDYFTSCLPWTQKGGTPISIPLTGSAVVKTSTNASLFTGTNLPTLKMYDAVTGANAGLSNTLIGFNNNGGTTGEIGVGTNALSSPTAYGLYPSNLYADLTTATATTINALRLSFQTQKLLERDARGGTRYTEIIRSHFGVTSPDMRLQRPEYLGGGKSPVNITPVPQTTATGLTGGSSPMGTLAAVGLGTAQHAFRYSATEHGHIIGLVAVRADQIYQQGIRRFWSRKTRYDFYFPAFAMLGEQGVLNQEIYSDGSANDALVFGYQERWAEYRYHPSYTSAYFRSTTTTPLDSWHCAQKYTALPVLNATFVNEQLDTILQRNLAAGAAAANQEFLADFYFDERVARPMPMYSVPGLIDHF